MWMERERAADTVCPKMARKSDGNVNPMLCQTAECQHWVVEDVAKPDGRGRCVDVVQASAQAQAARSLEELLRLALKDQG